MKRKNQSYVYQTYMAILERHVAGDYVTLGGLLDARGAPLRHYAGDQAERMRVSGALASLHTQGVLRRMDWRRGRHRVYMVEWLDTDWTPRQHGNPLGRRYAQRQTGARSTSVETQGGTAARAKPAHTAPQERTRANRLERAAWLLQRAAHDLSEVVHELRTEEDD